MAYLVLVRHGQSEYNAKGWWTGWDNPLLTGIGKQEAKAAGERLKDIQFNEAYASALTRSQETLHIILETIGQPHIPVTINAALNERNYGDFTKKNKWEVQKEIGEEEFQKIRRGWDYPIPNGETLKQVYEREIPYFKNDILPKLSKGENIILASSGNSLRALVKYLEHVPETEIHSIEIPTGEVYVYQLDEKGNVIHKEIRK
jgi:2,3-bisphosphoglycerate-dependent phosphoglycerate mutase